MKLRNVIIAAAIAATPMFAQAAGDAAAGKAIATQKCAMCHGANGKSAVPMYPNLAGQHATYLANALKDYKNGKRTGQNAAMMAPQVAALTDADIANLAAYFAAQ